MLLTHVIYYYIIKAPFYVDYDYVNINYIQGVSSFMIRTSDVVRKAHFKVGYSYKHMPAKTLLLIYRVIILSFFISVLSNIFKPNLIHGILSE